MFFMEKYGKYGKIWEIWEIRLPFSYLIWSTYLAPFVSMAHTGKKINKTHVTKHCTACILLLPEVGNGLSRRMSVLGKFDVFQGVQRITVW